MNKFRQLTLDGLSWNLKNQLFSQIINLAIGITLVRLLAPEDFGLIAMVLIISTFAAVLRNLGLNEAVIQRKETNDKIISTVFWIQVLAGGILALIFYLSAPYIASFYNEPLLKPIVAFFCLEYFIGTFGMLQFALLQKELNYQRIFYINLISISCSGLVAITMAYCDFMYWSLVAKALILTLMNTCQVWIFSGWKPLFILDIKIAKKLFNYSLPLLGNQLLNFIVRNIDDLLIGKILGQQALGLYNRSYALMLMPLTNISRVIANVLFPSFAKIQDDPARVKQIYLKVIGVVGLITFPMMMGLFVLAEPFVHIVFGAQWVEMVPVIKILSILGLGQSIGMFNGVVFLSTGHTLKLFKIEIFSKSFMIAMIIFGIYYTKSIEGVALFYTLASIIVIFPAWYYMGKLIGTTIFEILKNITGVFVTSIVMSLCIYLLRTYFFIETENMVTFFLQIIIGIIIYWLCLILFRIEAYKKIKGIVLEKRT